MSLLNFARGDVVAVRPEATVHEAVGRIKKNNVGCLVALREGKPVGVLTDRDVMLRVTGEDGDQNTVTVTEVMTPHPVTLKEELELFEALEIMKDKGVRRFPVTDQSGNLSGFFTLDDALYMLGLELSEIARIIDQEIP